MYDVKIYPTTLSQYSSQVYAGFFDLAKAGKLNIKIMSRSPGVVVQGIYPLYVEVEEHNTGKHRKILFDLADTGRFDFSELVPDLDYIAKRSYSDSFLKDLPDSVRNKIHPYGINYNCSSPNIPFIKLFLHHHFLQLKRDFIGHVSGEGFIRNNIRFLMNIFKNNYSLFEEDYRSPSEPGEQHDIFFITRLFPHSRWEDDARIELIEKLRENFGSRFYGGIEDDETSRARCKQEILISRMPRREYINKMKNARIVIVIRGANKSNPWKLGESLASSSCIVCSDLEFMLSAPLVDNLHYRKFENVDDCVRICKELLDNPGKIDEIKNAANEYYDSYVRCDVLVSRVLEHAFLK